jgi:hyperosmotically inducible protein
MPVEARNADDVATCRAALGSATSRPPAVPVTYIDRRLHIMNRHIHIQLVAALVASTAVLAACGDNRTDTASGKRTESVATAPDRVANATDRVTTKAAVAVDDTAITTKVKAAVMAEPGLKTLDINVDTKDGVVTLAGTVQSPELKQRAVTLAQQVEGVRSVSDQLVVKQG